MTGPKFNRWLSGWRLWILLAGLWTIPAITFAVTIHARMLLSGTESSLIDWIVYQMYGWMSWVPLTVLILWLARKVRIQREGLGRALVIHSLGCVVLVAIHLGYYVWLFGVMEYTEPMTLHWWWTEYLFYITIRGPWAIFLYWFILGVYYSWDYYQKYRDRELQASQLETELVRSQLEALKDRLQPHFLYNALHSVAMLVRKGDQKAAVDMLAGLSELLRYVLEKGERQFVTLAEEIDFVQKYLGIQQVRFSDRLRTFFDVPKEYSSVRVPFLIAQPLVENSLHHGIAPKKEGGTIMVTAHRSDDSLVLTVSDDGVGPGGTDVRQAEGLGLRNIRERLQRLYGDGSELTTDTPESGGFTASVTIPFELFRSEDTEDSG